MEGIVKRHEIRNEEVNLEKHGTLRLRGEKNNLERQQKADKKQKRIGKAYLPNIGLFNYYFKYNVDNCKYLIRNVDLRVNKVNDKINKEREKID